jgi:hypothetical protein
VTKKFVITYRIIQSALANFLEHQQRREMILFRHYYFKIIPAGFASLLFIMSSAIKSAAEIICFGKNLKKKPLRLCFFYIA